MKKWPPFSGGRFFLGESALVTRLEDSNGLVVGH
jgi:hypothetical protein